MNTQPTVAIFPKTYAHTDLARELEEILHFVMGAQSVFVSGIHQDSGEFLLGRAIELLNALQCHFFERAIDDQLVKTQEVAA